MISAKQRSRALRQMRMLKKLGTPVALAAEGWNAEWKILIAIIMSARTRDETTIKVGKKLFLTFPSLNKLACASISQVETIVRPVNFFHNKARSVILCARMLVSDFNAKIPSTLEELISLPGVGRKTANVFLAEQGRAAIGVDTHVAYISRTLHWTHHTDPKKVEQDLSALFPRKEWRNINTSCVRFGKTYLSRKKKDALLSSINSLR
ncbi:MAG: hypothetical protein A2664_01085 [Candidatus Taylorbacteria bacterium RIFCSPHIGHO2_01_FULL_46_22b]|uniref:HhH-GPD domain-containing protein n=1 Tax=Candidatus Taylorbacteria bacterium RIFCSPHIGHO2_01_FULL_46_22b TaxID=1802301 RepID=A0A1G2M286_9BACT|nr:MAG: hypothetical protein A2664_01085 [Candidatus Taylorbacteria bacterium RIFCSPHIGHO2_01_FULL_46_22b]